MPGATSTTLAKKSTPTVASQISGHLPCVKYFSRLDFPTMLSPIRIILNWYANAGSTPSIPVFLFFSRVSSKLSSRMNDYCVCITITANCNYNYNTNTSPLDLEIDALKMYFFLSSRNSNHLTFLSALHISKYSWEHLYYNSEQLEYPHVYLNGQYSRAATEFNKKYTRKQLCLQTTANLSVNIVFDMRNIG